VCVCVSIDALPPSVQGENVDKKTDEPKILLRPDFLDMNPSSVEGEPVFEGDLLLTKTQRRHLSERKAISSSTYRWPRGPSGYPLVPYVFGDDKVDRAEVRRGIEHWDKPHMYTLRRHKQQQQQQPPYPHHHPAPPEVHTWSWVLFLRGETRERCVKWLQSPSCYTPRLTFTSFRLYDKRPYCGDRTQLCCYFDSLEIRTENVTSGQVLAEVSTTTTTTPTTPTNIPTSTNTPTNIPTSTNTLTTTTTPSKLSSPALCRIEKYNNVYYWTSPYYGISNYPVDFRCGITASMWSGVTEVRLVRFNIQPKVNSVCLDYVTVQLPYDRQHT
ncbi:hypothetical protein Pmani_038058, partial [Petrolisthes manimaculis]